MDKEEVIARLCKLVSEVNARKFGYHVAADCFCGDNPHERFQFDPDALEYIEQVVRQTLALSTTGAELEALIRTVLLDADVQTDNEGQIVVYTGRWQTEDGTLLDHAPDEDEAN